MIISRRDATAPPCPATHSKRFYARALGVRNQSTTPCLLLYHELSGGHKDESSR
jgi:hypothetical protein